MRVCLILTTTLRLERTLLEMRKHVWSDLNAAQDRTPRSLDLQFHWTEIKMLGQNPPTRPVWG